MLYLIQGKHHIIIQNMEFFCTENHLFYPIKNYQSSINSWIFKNIFSCNITMQYWYFYHIFTVYYPAFLNVCDMNFPAPVSVSPASFPATHLLINSPELYEILRQPHYQSPQDILFALPRMFFPVCHCLTFPYSSGLVGIIGNHP